MGQHSGSKWPQIPQAGVILTVASVAVGVAAHDPDAALFAGALVVALMARRRTAGHRQKQTAARSDGAAAVSGVCVEALAGAGSTERRNTKTTALWASSRLDASERRNSCMPSLTV